MTRAFSPPYVSGENLGRCPRLVWVAPLAHEPPRVWSRALSSALARKSVSFLLVPKLRARERKRSGGRSAACFVPSGRTMAAVGFSPRSTRPDGRVAERHLKAAQTSLRDGAALHFIRGLKPTAPLAASRWDALAALLHQAEGSWLRTEWRKLRCVAGGGSCCAGRPSRIDHEHRRCADKPAQGNALGN